MYVYAYIHSEYFNDLSKWRYIDCQMRYMHACCWFDFQNFSVFNVDLECC